MSPPSPSHRSPWENGESRASPSPSLSPSMNPHHHSLPPETQRSSCRGECACETRITVTCSHTCFRCFLHGFFLSEINGKLKRVCGRTDKTLPFCAFLDGTSVDESLAPHLGLIGERKHCTHICSHAHFLHSPPPLHPDIFSHTHSFLLLPTLQTLHTSTFPNFKPSKSQALQTLRPAAPTFPPCSSLLPPPPPCVKHSNNCKHFQIPPSLRPPPPPKLEPLINFNSRTCSLNPKFQTQPTPSFTANRGPVPSLPHPLLLPSPPLLLLSTQPTAVERVVVATTPITISSLSWRRRRECGLPLPLHLHHP